MQIRLREEFDADRIEDFIPITDYVTDQNKYEITCGTCFKTLYADQETSEGLSRAIEEGLDNPFLCNDCEQELAVEAYDRR